MAEYRKRRLSAKNIAQGVRFFQQYANDLRRAEKQYGVPATIITAIIGVETRYGEITGAFGIAEALATLAFSHPTRGDEFKEELSHLLIYARDSRLDPLDIKGSYAGAFGLPQFLPSSIRRYAVDFNGNGRIDLFDTADTAGSIGNFLKMHGWQAGKGIAYPARIDGDSAALISITVDNGYKPLYSKAEWEANGVYSPAAGAKETADSRYLLIDLENRYDTEYRLGTDNFYALTRYNKSFKYAAVVADLAAAIGNAI